MAIGPTFRIKIRDENRNQLGHPTDVAFMPAIGMRLTHQGTKLDVLRVDIDLQEAKASDEYIHVEVTVRPVR